jgi:hypothetical protein
MGVMNVGMDDKTASGDVELVELVLLLLVGGVLGGLLRAARFL